MSREILFKAKRIDNGEWVEGYYVNIAKINPFIATGKIKLKESLEGHLIPEMHAIDTSTLCRYAGLTDMNDQKIWENDIVAFTDMYSTESEYAEMDCTGKVVWDEETISFQVTGRLSCESYEVLGEGCVVIGNIFDNPELMEGIE